MAITITGTKSGRRGGPAVEIAYDKGTKLDAILAAQKSVFADKRIAHVTLHRSVRQTDKTLF